MPEADVLEELRALEIRRAAAALPPDAEERRAEILAGLEGEALRLERDLARAAARLRLIAEFLPPELSERAFAAAAQGGAPFAPAPGAPEAAAAAPFGPAPRPTLGEYDADLPTPLAAEAGLDGPGAAPGAEPDGAAARAEAVAPSPEAAPAPAAHDPLPPDAPADAEPWPPLALGELPGAPPDAEPQAPGPVTLDGLADPSAEPPFPAAVATAVAAPLELGSYAGDLAGCPEEPGGFEPPPPGHAVPEPGVEAGEAAAGAPDEAAAESEAAAEAPEPEVEWGELAPEGAADLSTSEGGPEAPEPKSERAEPAPQAAEPGAEPSRAGDGLPEPEVEWAEPALETPEPGLDAFESAAEPPEQELDRATPAPEPAEPDLDLAADPQPAVADPAPEVEVVEGFDPPDPPAPSSVFPGEHRVVVHVVDGPVRRGVLVDPDLLAPELALASAPGAAPEPIRCERVKAVFFMADPGALPPPPGERRLTVTFQDGRQLAGTSDDYAPGRAGFFLVPADWRSAAERIWIYADAIRQLKEG